MSIKLIIDSASDIPMSYAQQHDMIYMPLKTNMDGVEYLDGITLTHEAFYQRLPDCKTLPTTSQVAPYDYQQAFERVKADGDQAVVITISGKLSGTLQSALLAAKHFADCVCVVDSENATVGEYVLVEYAMRLRDSGLDFRAIAGELEQKKRSVCLIGMVDTLEYLVKGGRLSKAAGIAGTLLGIKPVVGIEDGVIISLGRARGSRQSSNLLTQTIDKKGGIDFSMPLMLGYSGVDDALLKGYIENSRALWEGRADSLPVTTLGSTIGSHVGPGAVAIAFFAANQA